MPMYNHIPDTGSSFPNNTTKPYGFCESEAFLLSTSPITMRHFNSVTYWLLAVLLSSVKKEFFQIDTLRPPER
jgi:hypothetical protein